MRTFAGITVLVGLCWSVSAQSQSPTAPTPRPAANVRPSPSSGVPWDGANAAGGGGLDSQLGGGGRTGRRSGGSLFDRDKQGAGDSTGTETAGTGTETEKGRRGRDRESKEAEKPGENEREQGAGKAAADTGGGKESSSSSSSSSGGVQTIGGGSGGGGTGGGTQGGGGGGGTNFTKGNPGTVSVAGDSKFEPVLERDVSYGEVPDEGEPITLEGPMSIAEFLAAINLATNWNILAAPELQDVQLRFWISDTKPKDALDILKFYKIYYEFEPETKFLHVMSEEDYLKRNFGKRKPKEFHVENVDVAFAESMIKSLLSETGRAVTDQRTGIIYVWDTEDNISEMDRIFQQVDVPLQREEFKVLHADLPDIESVLSSLLSPSGNMLADVRTGQVFVWDSPVVLEQMRLAVERLDLPVESKTFELRHVNAEDVTDSIESLLTERGSIQVDPRSNTLIVTDLPTRIEKIAGVVETLDRPLETRTWTIQYADLDFIADEIETFVPSEMGNIIVNEDAHQITVKALASRLEEIDKLITTWDIRRRQVLIEAFIVEVSSDVERAFNINWSYFGSTNGKPVSVQGGEGFTNSTAAPGTGQNMNVGQLPYAVPLYGALQLDESGNIVRPQLSDISGKPIIDRFAGNKLALALDYLDKQSKATILSSPRVTVQDGEEAVFENATRVPYVSASTYYGGGYGGYYNNNNNNNNNNNYYPSYGYGNNNTNRVEFIDVGTILTVYPRITEDQNILLEISAEDSNYTDKNVKVNDQESTIPEKTIRRADTVVRVNSGDTVVLGGLRKDRTKDSSTKTPFLGDLPLVGRLFKNPSKASANNSLLIFITTTIVGEESSPETMDLLKIDHDLSSSHRHNKKDLWGRLRDDLSKGANEIGVSIGQGGQMHSGGKAVTLEEVRAKFNAVTTPASVRVVLRKHPAAPLDVVNGVVEAAMEAGMKVDFDTDMAPIIPSAPKEKGGAGRVEAAPAAETAAAPAEAEAPAPIEPVEVPAEPGNQ